MYHNYFIEYVENFKIEGKKDTRYLGRRLNINHLKLNPYFEDKGHYSLDVHISVYEILMDFNPDLYEIVYDEFMTMYREDGIALMNAENLLTFTQLGIKLNRVDEVLEILADKELTRINNLTGTKKMCLALCGMNAFNIGQYVLGNIELGNFTLRIQKAGYIYYRYLNMISAIANKQMDYDEALERINDKIELLKKETFYSNRDLICRYQMLEFVIRYIKGDELTYQLADDLQTNPDYNPRDIAYFKLVKCLIAKRTNKTEKYLLLIELVKHFSDHDLNLGMIIFEKYYSNMVAFAIYRIYEIIKTTPLEDIHQYDLNTYDEFATDEGAILLDLFIKYFSISE